MSDPIMILCLPLDCSHLVGILLIMLSPSEGTTATGDRLVPSNCESGSPQPADIEAGGVVVHPKMNMYVSPVLCEGLHCKGAR